MKRGSSFAFAGACVATAIVTGSGCGSASRPEPADDPPDSGRAPPPSGDGIGGGFGDKGDSGVSSDKIDAGCATGFGSTRRLPAYLEIVLDGSGSMGDDKKWSAAVAALDAIFDSYYERADPDVAVGLLVFSDEDDPTGGSGPYPNSIDVAPAFVDKTQHDKLRARIDRTSYKDSTPTYEALLGGYRVMKPFVPAPPLAPDGHKIVVLVSDGVPNNLQPEQDKCVHEALVMRTELPAPYGPIETFSVGIGPFPDADELHVYSAPFMSELAIAGGTRAAPDCEPRTRDDSKLCHFQITPGGKKADQITREFVDALNRIRIHASCHFALERSGDIDPKMVNVTWTDGQGVERTIVQNPADGWTYDNAVNPTKVILHGEACRTVSTARHANVRVVLGCSTVVR